MAHTRAIDVAVPAGGDQLSGVDDEIRNEKVDVQERMRKEHGYGNDDALGIIADDGNSGKDDDGIHVPGGTSVVDASQTAATIAGGAYNATAYNGSVALASDTKVLYVKKGDKQAIDGTWTAISASGYSPIAMAAGTATVTFPNGMIFKWGTQTLTNTTWADTTVTFAAAFPTACLAVQVTGGHATDSNGDFAILAHTLAAASFKIRSRIGTRLTPARWFAIGY